MENNIDYSQYSFDELVDARNNIDAEVYPDRANELSQRIATHPDNPDLQNQVRPSPSRTAKVLFHGDGKEYFKIWIVNILLTIVTLGIYSAWATVRNNRYFYSNTEIDGHRMSYLAQPLQILKGRIIAVSLLVLYYVMGLISPIAQVIAIAVIALFAPFIIRMSLRFKFRMAAYRNVTFNFKASVFSAYWLFMLLPLIAFASVGLIQFAAVQGWIHNGWMVLAVFVLFSLIPLMSKMVDTFIYANAMFGNKPFKTQIKASKYYLATLASAGLGFGLMIVFGIVMAVVFGVSAATFQGASSMGANFIIGYTIAILMYLVVILTVSSLYTAWIRNHVYGNTEIEDVCRFESNVETMDLVYLRLTNLVMTIFTLGLAIPWVKVRTAHFFASATQVEILSGADSVVDRRSQSSAIGEEVADVFDFDIGIA